MLNYAYALMHASMTRAVLAVGLDPSAGFLHSSSRNKPALVLDVGEQFRAPIADSAVRTLLSKNMVSESDFRGSKELNTMSNPTLKLLATTVFDRLATSHNYIEGGYEMTWERSMEYVMRRLLRFVDGTLTTWEGTLIR